MKLLLDSGFIIDLLNGMDEAAARHARIFEAGDDALVNEIVICEVRAGLRDADAWRLESMIGPLEFVQASPDAAIRAGSWRERARLDGRHLSLADAIIASAAFGNDATIVTRNVMDFALTPVRIETY